MKATVREVYDEFKKCPDFSMTMPEFLLWLMRKHIDQPMKWYNFKFWSSMLEPRHCYLHVDTLLRYFRWYTTLLEKKK